MIKCGETLSAAPCALQDSCCAGEGRSSPGSRSQWERNQGKHVMGNAYFAASLQVREGLMYTTWGVSSSLEDEEG